MAAAAVGRGSAMEDPGLVALPTGSSSRTQATGTEFSLVSHQGCVAFCILWPGQRSNLLVISGKKVTQIDFAAFLIEKQGYESACMVLLFFLHDLPIAFWSI
jgi:hypothetical protein